MSLMQPPALPPPVNNATKPKRSVSFLQQAVISGSDSDTSASPSGHIRSSFQPGNRKGYVRKDPVQSDSEADDDNDEDNVLNEHDQESENEDDDSSVKEHHVAVPSLSPNQTLQQQGPGRASGRPGRLGQNYVRKAPLNSDTETDEDDEEKRKPVQSTLKEIDNTDSRKDNNEIHSEDDLEKDVEEISRSIAQSRISKPGQNYVRKAPVNSDTESDEEQPSQKTKDAFTKPAVEPPTSPSQLDFTSPQENVNIVPAHSTLGTVPQSIVNSPTVGMSMSNPSSSSLNSLNSLNGATAVPNVANPMSIYQQQQQEMLLIMQQQQIQIATMHQQQQAYQLLMLQQQQQHQQQLQAIQIQHSQSPGSNGSINAANDDDDDDLPLGEKKEQLPQVPAFMRAPPLQHAPMVHLSPDAQSSTLSLPFSASRPYSTPLQHLDLQHTRQPSTSSIHSLNSVHSATSIPQALLQPTSTPSPMLSAQQLHHPLQHQYPLANPQPRFPDYAGEEQFGGLAGAGGPQLLTSGFPAGYRGSLGSASFAHLNLDRMSVNSLHSAGSNGSNNGGLGQKPNTTRHSLLPHFPQQTLLQSISPSISTLPSHPHLHHTLIHVEAKPPPPQTGLVGTISAMEREKKLAKAQGTNQLQYQHQYQQQQMMLNAEKERWLQEQRRMAWETEQSQQQHQYLQLQQLQQLHLQQQQQQLHPSQYMLPTIPTMPSWTVADDEDDDRPLGAQ
ncbi:hypothetical protein BX616_009511 [Lobosporangium transversale]|uniref:Uncharacterized protein n=1 Tax=Lobosporangium transversale TaxID=64571 RepID=A0A1Y2G7M6_9FUNG|nr:hypothetical protein BCR41DRAFT_363572 [Lobosporangium transversale]KAF9913826.1 hypothetical protein BX616_009511 [Lobosporangium transversale]ORZ00018.1 hypothetical protein BCR41DRAFT_363572 [Lobosporangium transversale]|eukprot:XP_021876059.1 hypothetical protein BCR41DRAFT_363572 [Lobosporangium transversale]